MPDSPNVKDEEQQAAAKPAAGPSKLVPMILVANTVLMGVVLVVVLLHKPAPAGGASPPAKPAAAAANAKAEGKEGKEGEGHGEGHGEGAAAKGEGAPEQPGDPSDPAGAPGPILKLENFIIQLRGTDTDRYVRVAFDLELASEADRSPVQARMPHIRDAIISYFSDRSLDELRGSEGMDRIKTAVLKKLEEIAGGKRVRSVFITELVIQ
jgi:flagellar protein FliL